MKKKIIVKGKEKAIPPVSVMGIAFPYNYEN